LCSECPSDCNWNKGTEKKKFIVLSLQVAMRRVHPPEHIIPSSAPTVKQEQSNLLYWLPQLWGWNYMTSVASTVPESAPSRTEIELEDQILNVLVDSVENNTILRRDVVFGQFNFTLKQGTFHLCTTKMSDSELEAEKYVKS
jgi:vacuolar protein sorting-associated protein 13D